MNFRNFADLERCIVQNLYRIPRDVELVVGIPRSGLLAALPISLHLNVPLTDVDGLEEGRLISSGSRLSVKDGGALIQACRRILLIDDSLAFGTAMREVRNRVEALGLGDKVLFGAVYVSSPERGMEFLDYWFEHLPLPRIFAWNLMHSWILEHACVDIDGVLCIDPTEEQNDDGPRYREFLRNATPLFVPRVRINSLVTSRLEKYRLETEAWLRRHEIQYDQLEMLDLPTMKARRQRRIHGQFKAEVFRRHAEAEVFVESDPGQAWEIAELSRKPTICVQTQELFRPSFRTLTKGAIHKTPGVMQKKLHAWKERLKARLLQANRW